MIFQVTIETLNFPLMFLYPPTKKNILAAVRDDPRIPTDSKAQLRKLLEPVEYTPPELRHWRLSPRETFVAGPVGIGMIPLRENRVP
jgi:hypothetical protein